MKRMRMKTTMKRMRMKTKMDRKLKRIIIRTKGMKKKIEVVEEMQG